MWVILEDDGFEALDPTGVLAAAEPPVAVMVAPATVLEGARTAQLTDGTEIELSPERTFHTIEAAEKAAEAFTGERER